MTKIRMKGRTKFIYLPIKGGMTVITNSVRHENNVSLYRLYKLA
jgi:hypothetical protein